MGVTLGYTPSMTREGIRRIRRKLGLTQLELARLLGVDRVAIARWETGVRNISEPLARLLRLLHAEALGKAPQPMQVLGSSPRRSRRR